MIETQTLSYNERWIVDIVQKVSDTVSHIVTDASKLENRMHTKISKYLKLSEGNKENRRYIERMAYKEAADAVSGERNKKENAIHYYDLNTRNKEGQAVEYEPEDVLANVESSVEIKETINLLAKADRRRELILTEWMYGNNDETDISRVLADALGGNARSHCRFVQRFKIECRNTLIAAEAI